MTGKSALLLILLSFGVGSVWITLTTVLADRFGSKIGGFIGGLPSTAAVSLFFIGFTQSPETAAQATTVFPLSYAFTGLFLVLYALLWRRGFWAALLLSLSTWFGLSACVVVFHLENFLLSVGVYILFFCCGRLSARIQTETAFNRRGEIEIYNMAGAGKSHVRRFGCSLHSIYEQSRRACFRGNFFCLPGCFHFGACHQL